MVCETTITEPWVTSMEISEIVALYHSAWNEPDEMKRNGILEKSCANDGVYQDPDGTVEGRAALVAHIRVVFVQGFPAGRSSRQAVSTPIAVGVR
jgi:hypothetical protein